MKIQSQSESGSVGLISRYNDGEGYLAVFIHVWEGGRYIFSYNKLLNVLMHTQENYL